MPEALRVFIADDEAPARERLRELLADLAAELPTQVVGEAQNGVEAVERLPATRAQVLLLDIEMPGMRGLEVARHLSGLETAPAVIFVTAHDRYAVEAFELNALDYLMKPVRAARLAAALTKACAAGPPAREQLAKAAAQARDPSARRRQLQAALEAVLLERVVRVAAAVAARLGRAGLGGRGVRIRNVGRPLGHPVQGSSSGRGSTSVSSSPV